MAQERSGGITAEDLGKYEALVRKPVKANFLSKYLYFHCNYVFSNTSRNTVFRCHHVYLHVMLKTIHYNTDWLKRHTVGTLDE